MPLCFFAAALAALFPPRCPVCGRVVARGRPVCPACETALEAVAVKGEPCPVCGRGRAFCICAEQARRGCLFAFEGSVSPFYYEGAAKRGILRLKFSGQRSAADVFARAAAGALAAAPPARACGFVTNVPLSRRERRRRGYDQSEDFARALAARLGIPYRPALRKRRDTRPQRECGAAERWSNVAGVFAALPGAVPAGATVLLADDVFTTGATLHACAQALRGAGAKRVCCVTAACVRLTGARPPSR